MHPAGSRHVEAFAACAGCLPARGTALGMPSDTAIKELQEHLACGMGHSDPGTSGTPHVWHGTQLPGTSGTPRVWQ